MLSIVSFTFNPFQENTYLIYDDERTCVVIDPGCYERHEQEELADYISTQALKVTKLVNTHAHIDHVLGNAFVKEKYGSGLALSRIEEPYLRAVTTYAPNYGFNQYAEAEVDEYLDDSMTLTVGRESLAILFTPGHSPGHLSFYHEPAKLLISGDVLFYNSIGRTDLPGGDHAILLETIQKKLFKLPDDVTVYPGHGPLTTIGFEKRTNPFCAIT